MGNYGGPSPGDTVVTGVALAVKCIPHAAQTYAKNHHGDIVVEHPERPTTYGTIEESSLANCLPENYFLLSRSFFTARSTVS